MRLVDITGDVIKAHVVILRQSNHAVKGDNNLAGFVFTVVLLRSALFLYLFVHRVIPKCVSKLLLLHVRPA